VLQGQFPIDLGLRMLNSYRYQIAPFTLVKQVFFEGINPLEPLPSIAGILRLKRAMSERSELLYPKGINIRAQNTKMRGNPKGKAGALRRSRASLRFATLVHPCTCLLVTFLWCKEK